MSGAGGRVRVTSPQTRVALARRHRPAQHLLPLPSPESGADTEAARALFRRQRRLAARTLGLLGGLLLGLSGLLWLLPAPLSWVVLMVGSYPLLLLIAVCHVRAAERNEDRAP
ncbi:hypothetical protein [Streptomyces carpaticus]|uniref:DUF3040 domain-containing protein n=1 Tax=Streptomyces carpaticus TaxID=285558 RepID=A0ABV4ZSF7_9ACTN